MTQVLCSLQALSQEKAEVHAQSRCLHAGSQVFEMLPDKIVLLGWSLGAVCSVHMTTRLELCTSIKAVAVLLDPRTPLLDNESPISL